MIELNLSYRESSSWVLDTGCASHICNNLQALTSRRKLDRGDVDLRLGNGAKVAAQAVGTAKFKLQSGEIMELYDCYYVPSIIKNIISISCLTRNSFSLSLENNICSIYHENKLFTSANMLNDLYLLDVACDVYLVNQSLDDKGVNKAYL